MSGVVGFRGKGLHDGPLVCDRFSGARGDLFNKLPMPCSFIPEAIVMVVCPTFMSHLPDEFLLSLSHSCDKHMRHGLSHSKYELILT